MSDKRTITVSITINLGNYENLRLEVSDTAETKEEADELRHFLADVLDGYGKGDATAKHAIDKYKERILSDSAEEIEETLIPSSFEFETDCMPAVEPSNLPEPVEEKIIIEPEVLPPLSAAQEEQPPKTGEFTCSKCGAPVDKLQRDVSMMFNNKILCKNCMK